MRNQNGFTLIELVVVIVILGILAAVAVPKFVDMQVDARVSAVNGMYGAVQSASALSHAQALVKGKTAASGDTISMEGATVNLAYAYADESANGIANAVNTDGFFFVAGTGSTPAYFYYGTDATRTDCRVSFEEAADATTPPVISVTDTCAN